jgi:type II secretory pathway pseudopilin PulG
VVSAAAQPLWPGEWTAIGTLALAVVTLAAVMTTIIITMQDRRNAQTRLKEDRTRAAELLADERRYAAGVLATERQAADDRLTRQLEHSEAQLRAERVAVQEQEQEAGAWAVEVKLAVVNVNDPSALEGGTKRLIAVVTNSGPRTISQIRARFSPDGKQWVPPLSDEHVSTTTRTAATEYSDTIGHIGVLPSGNTMRFSSAVIGERHLIAPDVIVRWRDALNQGWEYAQGGVRKIYQSESPWW